MTDIAQRTAEILLYQSEDGRTRVEVRFEGETAWLSLTKMAELFQRDKSVVSRHIKNVFDEGELDAKATVAKSATVQKEGGREITRAVEYFNLDVMCASGGDVHVSRLVAIYYGRCPTSRIRRTATMHTTARATRCRRTGPY